MKAKNNFAVWAVYLVCACLLPGRGDETPSRSKVVMVEDGRATTAFEPQPAVVQEMVNRGMLKFTGKADIVQAWRTIVATQDVVGIKVFSAPGTVCGTRPAVVSAVVRGLLGAGLASSNIIIWDRQLADLRAAGFDDVARLYDVRLAGSADRGYDGKTAYTNELLGNLEAGDYEFDTTGAKVGRNSYVSRLVSSNMTKIITVTPLLNNNLTGVTGHLYSLAMGSVDNLRRFEYQAPVLARAVPEIYALPALSDRVVLCVTDALIGQYEGEHTGLVHYSTPVDQIWFSQDPVALDVLAIQELDRERKARQMDGSDPNLELYRNATLLQLGVSAPGSIQIELVK